MSRYYVIRVKGLPDSKKIVLAPSKHRCRNYIAAQAIDVQVASQRDLIGVNPTDILDATAQPTIDGDGDVQDGDK